MLIIVDEEILLDLAEDRFIIATQASKEKKIKKSDYKCSHSSFESKEKKEYLLKFSVSSCIPQSKKYL